MAGNNGVVRPDFIAFSVNEDGGKLVRAGGQGGSESYFLIAGLDWFGFQIVAVDSQDGSHGGNGDAGMSAIGF